MEKALKATAILEHLMTFCGVELHNDCAEAIKELKEIVKPKTCNGCVHEVEDMQDLHCAFCSRSCDDNFEPKDNA